MIPSLVFALRYRVPLLLTGSVFALIFFVSLGDRVGFAELVGASMLAGAGPSGATNSIITPLHRTR